MPDTEKEKFAKSVGITTGNITEYIALSVAAIIARAELENWDISKLKNVLIIKAVSLLEK